MHETVAEKVRSSVNLLNDAKVRITKAEILKLGKTINAVKKRLLQEFTKAGKLKYPWGAAMKGWTMSNVEQVQELLQLLRSDKDEDSVTIRFHRRRGHPFCLVSIPLCTGWVVILKHFNP